MTNDPEKEPIEQDEVIDAAFRVFLGRQPDEDADLFTNYAKTTDTQEAVEFLAKSAEARGDWKQDEVPILAEVKAMYNLFLHREPEAEAMGYWMKQAAKDGTQWTGVVDDFTGTAMANGEEMYHHQALDLFLA